MINVDVSKEGTGAADFSLNIKLEFNQTHSTSSVQHQHHVSPLTCCAFYPFRLFVVSWDVDNIDICLFRKMMELDGNRLVVLKTPKQCVYFFVSLQKSWCHCERFHVGKYFSFRLTRPDNCFTTRKTARIYSRTRGLLLVTVQNINISAICAAGL